ncbi:hypothetical protein CBR_g45218 [Chara braunii]|uniref:Peptidase M1 leukotriene A4 hydrolase/aminopeptidase C-terminal domain-containing protein n=1 Tax=Chara braunii TaxID=69332 RepID=A0A388K375_CHABU|nr:hypothetical protein CBR_g45218 [Chara braunii]|eukprot:GBG64522.1 hypothetical protein CBR_g45218 [Chara braunii]
MAPLDPHSFTDSDQPLTQTIHLNLHVDFEAKVISGSATLELDRPANGVLDLDTRDLHIDGAVDSSTGKPITFELEKPVPIKGSRLRLSLIGRSVTISFRTSSSASALQWLEPAQTEGGKLPYVYTHCQAIHARSVFPCQDTPRARIRYTADVNIPRSARAVMSAEHVGRVDLAPPPATTTGRAAGELTTKKEDGEEVACRREDEDAPGGGGGGGGDRAIEKFRMNQPIPPYLVALAVGDIVSCRIGPRSQVYAEPSILAAAAFEFAEVESMISQAESLFGPYDWEEFNVLVLPPAFPYGGMEHPRMVFLTPALVVGDRSLVNVVAHELAHSWTGNLVTNATANDFWLNEGFTTYAERRIVEKIAGADVAALQAAIGWDHLHQEIERFKDRPQLTRLRGDLEGVDPDLVFSTVPYEKGFLFLRRLENEMGREAFDIFLKKYISRFRFQSITTTEFVDFLKVNVSGIEHRIDLGTWMDGEGLPEDAPRTVSKVLDQVLGLAKGFSSGVHVSDSDCATWKWEEWQIYLDNMPQKMKAADLRELDQRFQFSKAKNLEILVSFLTIAANSAFQPCFPMIVRSLMTIGRMKYLRPLYSGLMASGSSAAKELARKTFADAAPRYHPVARAVIQEVLDKSK